MARPRVTDRTVYRLHFGHFDPTARDYPHRFFTGRSVSTISLCIFMHFDAEFYIQLGYYRDGRIVRLSGRWVPRRFGSSTRHLGRFCFRMQGSSDMDVRPRSSLVFVNPTLCVHTLDGGSLYIRIATTFLLNPFILRHRRC